MAHCHRSGGSVTEPDSIRGVADVCAAVIHMAAVVTESGDETFELVNVEGTRNVVREAERAGAVRLLYVSSLGADRDASAYHKSKLEGERTALASSLDDEQGGEIRKWLSQVVVERKRDEAVATPKAR